MLLIDDIIENYDRMIMSKRLLCLKVLVKLRIFLEVIFHESCVKDDVYQSYEDIFHYFSVYCSAPNIPSEYAKIMYILHCATRVVLRLYYFLVAQIAQVV